MHASFETSADASGLAIRQPIATRARDARRRWWTIIEAPCARLEASGFEDLLGAFEVVGRVAALLHGRRGLHRRRLRRGLRRLRRRARRLRRGLTAPRWPTGYPG